MKGLRLAEILLPLIAVRARAPWTVTPPQPLQLPAWQRGKVAVRRGGGSHDPRDPPPLFDDVQ